MSTALLTVVQSWEHLYKRPKSDRSRSFKAAGFVFWNMKTFTPRKKEINISIYSFIYIYCIYINWTQKWIERNMYFLFSRFYLKRRLVFFSPSNKFTIQSCCFELTSVCRISKCHEAEEMTDIYACRYVITLIYYYSQWLAESSQQKKLLLSSLWCSNITSHI